jgi:hypothetical protein
MSDTTLLSPTIKHVFVQENEELLKIFNLLGLDISAAEVETLLSGHVVSLEHKSLSEIGTIFIFAETLSSRHSYKESTFKDLLKVYIELSSHPGLPIHCWKSEQSGKCCLLLALVHGKLVLKAEFEWCSVPKAQSFVLRGLE